MDDVTVQMELIRLPCKSLGSTNQPEPGGLIFPLLETGSSIYLHLSMKEEPVPHEQEFHFQLLMLQQTAMFHPPQ